MEKKLKPALIDIPVLLIFFSRPDTFKQVFEKVKEARPTKLFLACDGPREGKVGEAEKVLECKQIAEDIDWECEVHTNYSEKNMGCGMKPQTSITWAFSFVDRLIILEDDCIPDITFFYYMQELLEKYRDDTRIGMISGLNHFKEWDCGGYSYGFAQNVAIWGWGTWKRVWQQYSYSLNTISDPYIQRLIKNSIHFKRAKKGKINFWLSTVNKLESGQNISYWDVQFGYLKFYQSYINIFPKHNLICNIGVGDGSTHATAVPEKKWHKGSLHFIPTVSIEIPLKCPEFVINDIKYDDTVDAIWGYPSFWAKNMKRVKRVIKKVIGR